MENAETYDTLPVAKQPLLLGQHGPIRQLGESRQFLFDLDDTIALYDEHFTRGLMLESLRAHVSGISDSEASHCVNSLIANNFSGSSQKNILGQYMSNDEIKSFWDYRTELFYNKIEPSHVEFSPGMVKLINFIIRNDMLIGIISNSTEQAGNKILDFYEDRHQVALHGLSTFLSSSSQRKPSSDALSIFESTTNIETDTSTMTYIGNSTSDLKFANNIGAVGVLLVKKALPQNSNTLSPKEQTLLKDSIQTTDAGYIKNHIETVMPNYSRPISITINRGYSGSRETYVDDKDISISPTEDNIYRIVTKGVTKITTEIPSIFEDFESTFDTTGNRSILSRPNYRSYFHDVTGAILIPNPDTISNNQYKNFYQKDRCRAEGDYYFARGPLYYRHFIPELEGDFESQVKTIENEIQQSIKTLSSTDYHPNPNDDEYLLRLGVMDNLRGNIQSLYLSVINVFREGSEISNPENLKNTANELKRLYSESAKLQYSFLLGIDVDQAKVIKKISTYSKAIAEYGEVLLNTPGKLKIKNPEIENSLLIAVRANKLIEQYPGTDVLVGLSSGGIELATVSKLLFYTQKGQDVDCVHYPISVHHGLSMWDKDKAHQKMAISNYSLLGMSKVMDKNVVICEDNSNSGQTLSRAVSLVKELGASQTNFAVVEVDPTRMLMHMVQQKIGHKHNIGQAKNRERPIANYFYPDFVGAVSVVKVLLADQSINKVIAQDTANRYNTIQDQT